MVIRAILTVVMVMVVNSVMIVFMTMLIVVGMVNCLVMSGLSLRLNIPSSDVGNGNVNGMDASYDKILMFAL